MRDVTASQRVREEIVRRASRVVLEAYKQGLSDACRAICQDCASTCPAAPNGERWMHGRRACRASAIRRLREEA